MNGADKSERINGEMNKHRSRNLKIVAMVFAVTSSVVLSPVLTQAGGAPPSEKGASQEEQSKIAGTPPFDLSDTEKIEAGKATFNSTCASFCHGQNPTLFLGRTGLSEEYVFDTIRDGGKGATPMPPWGDVFTREEIWELVAYLKSLGQW
jgi:mono/diheme cytochrome c family protein